MGYSIFDDLIKDNARFSSDVAQSAALVDAANLIADALRAQGLKQKELAVKLSVTEGYVSRLLSGDENLTVRSVARVLHALGMRYIQRAENNDASVVSTELRNVIFMDFNSVAQRVVAEVECTPQYETAKVAM